MVIVAGHLIVAPEVRDGFLAGCADVVRQARRAPGCLDFAISADPVATMLPFPRRSRACPGA